MSDTKVNDLVVLRGLAYTTIVSSSLALGTGMMLAIEIVGDYAFALPDVELFKRNVAANAGNILDQYGRTLVATFVSGAFALLSAVATSIRVAQVMRHAGTRSRLMPSTQAASD